MNNRSRNNRTVNRGRNPRGRNNRGRGRGRNVRAQRLEGNLYNLLNNDTSSVNLKNNYPFPNSKIYKLTLNNSIIVIPATNNFKVYDLMINNAHSPDIQQGAAFNPAGYFTISGIYTTYHVQKIKLRYQVINLESVNAISCALIFSDSQPGGNITSRTQAIDAVEKGLTSKVQLVGTIQGMNKYASPWYNVSVGHILGNVLQYMTDPSFCGSTSGTIDLTTPAKQIWGSFVYYSTGPNLTVGVTLQYELTMFIRFYGLRVLVSKINENENESDDEDDLKLRLAKLQIKKQEKAEKRKSSKF